MEETPPYTIVLKALVLHGLDELVVALEAIGYVVVRWWQEHLYFKPSMNFVVVHVMGSIESPGLDHEDPPSYITPDFSVSGFGQRTIKDIVNNIHKDVTGFFQKRNMLE